MCVKNTGLKIGGVASQNANHFWCHYESLCHSDSQYCESLLCVILVLITTSHLAVKTKYNFQKIWLCIRAK